MATAHLDVELGERSYPIYIGAGLLRSGATLAGGLRGSEALLVTNETIAPLYLDTVLEALAGASPQARIDTVVLPDGERHKTLEVLQRVFDVLLERRHSRRTTLLALGGGVVGDMTGFAAACYQRGADFVQLPTTLLAQVDSSVGGKTAVNHPLGKNMIGAFHQPRRVVIDTDVLATLPPREYAAGLAEVIKYGCIRDATFFAWLEGAMDDLLDREPVALVHAIHRSCEIKAEVVAEDEREADVRAILNFGHTFGHAIETHTRYESWLHGEAVGAGMVLAAELSRRLGTLADDEAVRVRDLVARAGLPLTPPADLEPARFVELMGVDKKVVDGRLRLITLEGLGRARIVADVAPAELDATLRAGHEDRAAVGSA